MPIHIFNHLCLQRVFTRIVAPPIAAALIFSLTLMTIVGSVRAENWPGWRGPRGDGTSREPNVPTRWNAEGAAWKMPISGVGHSSPIVWNDRVFVVSCLPETNERVLLCIDATSGKTVWTTTVVKAPLEKKHSLNSFASGTPVTDGELVYVSFLEADFASEQERTPGNMVVAAFDFQGNRRWEVRPGRFASVHGYCSCPVLFEDKLIINGDHDGDSYLVALHRKDGSTAWQVAREHKTRSYVTPIIRNLDGRTQMIMSGSKSVVSYDPQNGERHWWIDGPTEQFVASMVDNGKLLFLTAGFPEHHILAIRPDGKGNVTDSHIVWRTNKGCSYVPSPIISGDYFLVVSDQGFASCFDAATGERHWMQRLGDKCSASLVEANGLVYFVREDGVTKVVRPGKKYEEVASNELGEPCYASPAISNGKLYIRSERSLFCISP
ncbi:MAG: hypothetical protein RIS70_3170 [Planctomycetota bacterium]|jgi:outer membrane protein assembly factor BamB